VKILHCCLANFYIDNYSYQENILPREHLKLGYDVKIIASTETFLDNNSLGYTKSGSYFTEDGIPIVRIPYTKILPQVIMRKIRMYVGLYQELTKYKPDILFIHDLQFIDVLSVVRFLKKNPSTKVFVDCHADFSNSARSFMSKYFLHGILYRFCAKVIEPYTSIFWGVLPARVDFLEKMYGIPRQKIRLLVMGGEDEKIEKAVQSIKTNALRSNHGVDENDFLIVTGGKIDEHKSQTLLLMRAVIESYDKKIKLLIFGSISEKLKHEFEDLLSLGKVEFIGWIDADKSYDYFAIADLAVFPGRHSVFWEQAVSQGLPLVVKYWYGVSHIDLGGNVIFLHRDSVEEIKEVIGGLVENPSTYKRMKGVALNGANKFRYRGIAEYCISP
jgi:1,2-diacylglycerol 3-alpha-glucosyltransferase